MTLQPGDAIVRALFKYDLPPIANGVTAMRTLATLCALTCLLLAPFAQAVAAVYKYTDESGRTVFVDSESRIVITSYSIHYTKLYERSL